MNERTIAYLRQYVQNPRILSLGQLEAQAAVSVPAQWLAALMLEGEARVRCVLGQWQPFQADLPEVFAALSTRLESVQLLVHDGGLNLLYGIRGKDRTLFYASDNPASRAMRPRVSALWNAVPQSIKAFYDFADGWFYLASRSLGPAATADMFVLDEEDWGILDELDDPPNLDLSRAVAMFTNGAFAYVCADTSKTDATSAGVVWWSDKPPRTGQDFWGVVDAWTAIGLDG